MDSNPSADPNFLFAGNQAASFWYGAGGNPDTGGYMAISDAVDGQSLVAIFPVVDTYVDPDDGQTKPVPLKAFKLEADLRVGNPANDDGSPRPADGFSINFARLNDPIIYWATWTNPATGLVEPQARGAAGGDSDAQADQPASNPAICDSGTFENGTKTGVAVVFDAWEGNQLPRTGNWTVNGGGSEDIEGVGVRVDDVTQLQVAMPTRNGACTDTTSVQTGPWDNTGATANLCWARLVVELSSDLKLNVSYKGTKLLDNYDMTGKISLPMSGRIILMGRTGGNNQNTHVDNITLTTTPADIEAFLDSVTGYYGGFTFKLKDYQASQVNAVTQVLLDGTDVTAGTSTSKSGSTTTGTYAAPARLASGSSHTVTITYTTTLGQTLTKNGNFTVAPWRALPTSLALDQSAVSGPGFSFLSYQTKSYNQNTLVWTEEQIIGLRGKNYANPAAGTFNGPVNFGNNAAGAGQFLTETPWTTFGINTDVANFANEDNGTIEMFAYVYFPTSGVYTMMVGSDDGYDISYGKNAKERMGTSLMSFNGGRGVANAGGADKMTLLVDAPGAYPIRLYVENGGGGADLEWYFQYGTDYIPVNDPASPVLAYQFATATGPYVKSANPVRGGGNVLWNTPIVIELGDGTLAVNATTVALKVDGTAVTATATKVADITTVKQTGTPNWAAGAHTIELTFKDTTGTDYTYSWGFNVINLATYPVAQIPASHRKALADIETTKPGLMLLPYHTPADGNPNNMQWTEEQLLGLHGINSANLGPLPGGYYEWTAPVDFSAYLGGNASTAEWAYNADLSNFGGSSEANWTLEMGTWLELPAAGRYVMVVNSDDGFRLTSPQNNPLSRAGGVFIGQFNGGRGSTGPGIGPRGGLDYMVFEVPQAGYYPFRLLWQQGGGGLGVEWTVYQLLPNGGMAQLLVNDVNVTGSLKAYQQTKVVAPYVVYSYPVQGFTYVATTPLEIRLQDGTSAVVGGSIVLKVNGTTYSPTITASGGVTTIVQPPPPALWNNGVNTVELTFSDGTTTYTYTYTFIAAYQTLTAGFPLGSEDPAKPGFTFNVWQSATGIGPNDLPDEQLLSGVRYPNVANGATHVVAGTINMSGDLGGNGFFNAGNGYPETGVPGIPGSVGNTDNYAGEFLTYLEIPAAGLYRFGVNSDDGFKFTVTHARPYSGAVWVDSPSSLGKLYAIRADPAATAAAATAPVFGKLVAADPILANTPLVNAADIAGNIAICRRGAINFSTKIKNCFDAGAIAVIVVNNAAGDPITMGSTTPPGFQTIPAVMVRQSEGDTLLTTLGSGPVYVTVTPEASQAGANGAIFDGGRGASDTIFDVKALAPGIYPVRLIFYEGGGGDNIEFFSVDPGTGTKTLINDSTVAGSIKAFRALKAGVVPSLSIVPDGAGNVTITWTGTLQSANLVNGPYNGVPAVISPLTIPASAAKFFRAVVNN